MLLYDIIKEIVKGYKMFNQKEYNKKYYRKRKEEIGKKNKKYYQEHKEEHKERRKEYRERYLREHKEEHNRYNKKYRQEHREYFREYNKKRTKRRRLKVLNIVSNNNPTCVRCGCNDLRLLEINHKNGGGSQEMRRGIGSSKFWNNINNGKRETYDLEILCRVCNARHYLELKYGKLPYEIKYKE